MELEKLKKDLAEAERMLEQVKSQLYQCIGIKGYIERKIAELEKGDKEEANAS